MEQNMNITDKEREAFFKMSTSAYGDVPPPAGWEERTAITDEETGLEVRVFDPIDKTRNISAYAGAGTQLTDIEDIKADLQWGAPQANSVKNMKDVAGAMIEDLEGGRKLVGVAHSLGNFVIARSLMRASQVTGMQTHLIGKGSPGLASGLKQAFVQANEHFGPKEVAALNKVQIDIYNDADDWVGRTGKPLGNIYVRESGLSALEYLGGGGKLINDTTSHLSGTYDKNIDAEGLGAYKLQQTVTADDIAGYMNDGYSVNWDAFDMTPPPKTIRDGLKTLSNFQAGAEATARQDSLDALTRANLERMGVEVPSDQYLSSVMKAVQDRTPNVSASTSPGQLAGAIATTVAQELSRKRPGVTATLDGKISAPPVRADIIAKSVEQTIKSSWVPEDPVAKSWGAPAISAAQPQAQPPAARLNSITVRPGETLSEIAFKNDTSVRDLMLDNPHIKDPDRIDPGDVIDVSSRANIAPAPPSKPMPPTKAPKISGLPGWPESSITAGARAQVQEMARTAKAMSQGQSLTQAQAAPARDTITIKDTSLTAVGAQVDRATVDKLMRSPAYSNALHPEHETVAHTVRGYFKATTPDSVTVTTPDNDPALWSGVQRETEKRLAEQAKVGAAAESANTKSYAQTAAKTAQAESLSFTLSDFKSSKQTIPAKKTTLGGGALDLQLGGYARSLLDGAVPEFETTQTAKTLRDIRKSQQAPAQQTGASGGRTQNASGRAPTQEALYGANSTAGSLGKAGYIDANNKYQSGTTSRGQKTGGHHLDAQGREIGGFGQFTRDITGRTGSGPNGASSNTRVICTELVRQGRMAPSLQRLDIAFTLKRLSPATVRGYHFWAVPYVRLMKRSKLGTALISPLATWRAEEIAYQMGERDAPRWPGKAVRLVMEPLCWALGMVLGWIGDPDRFHPNHRAHAGDL